MRIVFAPALLCLTYLCLLELCRRSFGKPLALAGPLAAGLLICWEALLCNALSLVSGIVAWTVAAAHLVLIGALVVYLRGHSRPGTKPLFKLCASKLRDLRAPWMLAPLLLVLFVCALAYSPSTPDSMVYHLARVVHWMENRSVAYYPTQNARQNVMGPGAEYLLLALQLISRSDRWANFVQLAAYVIAVAASPAIFRIAGVPRQLSAWAALFIGSLPIVVLEATTTQNDLVAALLALAIVVTTLPFMHRAPRWQPRDLLLLAAMLGAGYLTKATSVLAVMPFLLWAAFRQLRSNRQGLRRWLSNWRWILSAVALFAALVGPDMFRKHRETGSLTGARYEVYPAWGEWQERLVNSLRATCQEIPDRKNIVALENLFHAPHAELFCDQVFLNSEDRSGNPLHVFVTIALLGWALLFCWGLRGRERLAALSLLGGWMILHAFVRNQEFITRLQLPVLILTPLAWPAFVASRLPGWRLRIRLLQLATSICFAYGFLVACTNVMKPLKMPALFSIDRLHNYYLYNWQAEGRDAGALSMLKETGCARLGLYFEEASYDYTITWRALKQGVEARDYEPPSDWPCLIYSERGAPPASNGRAWVPTREPGVFAPAR